MSFNTFMLHFRTLLKLHKQHRCISRFPKFALCPASFLLVQTVTKIVQIRVAPYHILSPLEQYGVFVGPEK
jgi:hypothetical protein